MSSDSLETRCFLCLRSQFSTFCASSSPVDRFQFLCLNSSAQAPIVAVRGRAWPAKGDGLTASLFGCQPSAASCKVWYMRDVWYMPLRCVRTESACEEMMREAFTPEQIMRLRAGWMKGGAGFVFKNIGCTAHKLTCAQTIIDRLCIFWSQRWYRCERPLAA